MGEIKNLGELYQAGERLRNIQQQVKEKEEYWRSRLLIPYTQHRSLSEERNKEVSEYKVMEEELKEKIAAYYQRTGDITSNLTFIKSWDYEIVDEKLIPEDFKTINHSALKAEVKQFGGLAFIPGIKIKEVINVRVRKEK